MAARNPDVRRLAAKNAALARWGRCDPQTTTALATARADDYIAKIVAQAPPLTDEQRSRLAALLTPHQVGGAA